MFAAVFELQHLHEELDVDESAGAAFQVRRLAVSSSRWRICEFHRHIRAARDGCTRNRRPIASQRLLARGEPYTTRALQSACRSQSWPRAFFEIAAKLGQRRGQRAALAGRPQPRIDFVQPAVRAELAADLDDPLAQLAEEMLVGGRVAAARAARRGTVAPSASYRKIRSRSLW